MGPILKVKYFKITILIIFPFVTFFTLFTYILLDFNVSTKAQNNDNTTIHRASSMTSYQFVMGDQTFQKISNLSSKHSQSPETRALNVSLDIPVDYYNSKSKEFSAVLQETGIQRPEVHAFQSPYIIAPPLYGNRSATVKAPGARKMKTISIYKINLSRWFIHATAYNRDFNNCPYSECKVDLNCAEMTNADLLLFVCNGPKYPPPHRPAGQLWAVGCWESGLHWRYSHYSLWSNAFNLTLSYRMDADFVGPYVRLAWRDSTALLTEDQYVTLAKQKTKTAVWFVSNCVEDRIRFVREMQKYIDIDIYGMCGNLKCPRTKSDICQQLLNTTYKFYLAFENSFCKEYVTEKFQMAFKGRTHIIPVGKGGLDYDRYFPPNTFVNGNKFRTAKDLALYLREIGNDMSRYAKMLQEKDKLMALPRRFVDWCDLCEMLHTDAKRHRVYFSIRSWSHKGRCRFSEYKYQPIVRNGNSPEK